MIRSRTVFGTRNVLHKSCRENQNTFYVQYLFFFENRAVYGIMLKIVVESDWTHMKTYDVCALHAE